MGESLTFFCCWKRLDLVDNKISYLLNPEDSGFLSYKRFLNALLLILYIQIQNRSKQPFSKYRKASNKNSESLFI